jgi:hypothetical protein
MSSFDYREPTNEELWPQPPATHAPPPSQAMVPQQPAPVPAKASSGDRSRFILAVVSMGMGIPISAIAAEYAGPFGLLIAWVAIVAVNFIYSWRRP